MSYEKKYGVGNVVVDTPYAHFIHELPLLSFGDVQHNINVSLIYQSKESGNPFNIANGFKFNLQKRLIMNGNIPEKFEDGNGKLIILNNCSNRFVFDDGSQRIIRAENSTFVLENPDYSKEVYDASGKITEVCDKYGNQYLTYEYIGNTNKLCCVTYRSKVILFDYDATSGLLKSLCYECNDQPICTIGFSCSAGNVIIQHYSGVDYHLTSSGSEFKVYSTEKDEIAPNENSHQLICAPRSNPLRVTQKKGDKIIDETTYNFYLNSESNKLFALDVTDYNGIKKRIQFEDDKPTYSYEIRSDMFRESLVRLDHDYIYPSAYFGDVTYYSHGLKMGVQEYNAALKMARFEGDNNWLYSSYITGDASQKTGLKYLVVSGWLKRNSESASASIEFYYEDFTDPRNTSISIEYLPLNEWVYFSHTILTSEIDNPKIKFESYWDISRLSTADFRITPYYENEEDDTPKVQTFVIGKVLAESETEIPLNPEPVEGAEDSEQPKVIFYNGNSRIEEDCQITENDIIRFMINQVYGTHTGEIYFNNCKGVMLSNNEDGLRVAYSDANGTTPIMDLKAARIEKRYSIKGNNYVTKIEFDSSNGADYGIIIQSFRNGSCYQIARYDAHHLDLVVSKKEQVETSYTRNNFGLITSQEVANQNGYVVSTIDILYDADCTKVVSTTDEFDQVTTYVTDDVWGVVTETHLSDDTVIKDVYDGDMSTLRHKIFSKDNREKVHHFNYPNEESLEVSDDTLQYTFENDFWVSGQQYIKKLGVPIEYHKSFMRDQTFEDSYPDYLDPVFKQTGTFDKYGRVTTVTGLIENKYDVVSSCRQGDARVTGIHNASSKLASSKDLTTGKTTKYAYEKGRVSKIGEFNQSDTMIAEETLSYDNIGRLVKDEYIYDKSGGKSVGSEIEYNRSADDPCADNRAYVYSYKVNNQKKVDTFIFYDSFKRVTQKDLTFYDPMFWAQKFFTYDKTRVSKVTDKYTAGQVMGISEYTYDNRGRITKNTYVSDTTASQETTYQYDEFGQLIRENNEALDKTYTYEYNSIGNITRVKEYAYHAPEEEEFPRCQKTVFYGYDAECPDKLTKFDGNVIEYNSIGYPTKYKDENYEWANGKLSKIHRSTFYSGAEHYATRTFTYDGYGRRTQVQFVSGVNFAGANAVYNYSKSSTHNYNYDNSGRLIRETYTATDFSGTVYETRELVYLYDESGIIGAMYSYNGSALQPYYYYRNLQGDVIAIYDANGEKHAEYAYDAWGNCEVVYADNDKIAYANPIRYRGYYYDKDTKLYYLNARYYSPEWRRFISPDAAEYIDPETPNGLNLYAYCYNDPVNYADPSGTFAFTTTMLIAMAIGAISLGTLGGITAYQSAVESGQTGWDLVNSTLSGVSTGIILGAAVGFVASASISCFVGGIASVAGKLIGDTTTSLLMGTNSFGSWESYAVAFVFGGFLKGAAANQTTKMLIDVFARPAFDQVVKMGTQGKDFNEGNYLYSVLVRGSTYGLYDYNVSTFLLGREISLSLEKIITRSFYTTMGKKFILN